jgi:hypothetical protein
MKNKEQDVSKKYITNRIAKLREKSKGRIKRLRDEIYKEFGANGSDYTPKMSDSQLVDLIYARQTHPSPIEKKLDRIAKKDLDTMQKYPRPELFLG